MPITTFEVNEKYGLINGAGIHLTLPIYESIEVYDEFIRGIILNEVGSEVHYLDHSGDLVANLNETLPEKYAGTIIEAYPLYQELRVIMHSSWDDRELFGVTNSRGVLLIEPEYAEFEVLPNGMIKSFHLAQYSEYDGDGNKLYGHKIHYRDGSLLTTDVFDYYEVDHTREKIVLHFKNENQIEVPLNP